MKLIIVLLLFYHTQGLLKAQHSHEDNKDSHHYLLSDRDRNYIYNRALDMILKDKYSTISLVGVFYIEHAEAYSDILVTIDPMLKKEALKAIYVTDLHNMKFEILEYGDLSDNVTFLNTVNIDYQHYNDMPELKDNHLTHVTFSPIHKFENKLYVGAQVINQISTTTGIESYISYVIYEIEKCSNGVVCFRKVYIPLGISLSGYVYTKHELNDRPCEF